MLARRLRDTSCVSNQAPQVFASKSSLATIRLCGGSTWGRRSERITRLPRRLRLRTEHRNDSGRTAPTKRCSRYTDLTPGQAWCAAHCRYRHPCCVMHFAPPTATSICKRVETEMWHGPTIGLSASNHISEERSSFHCHLHRKFWMS